MVCAMARRDVKYETGTFITLVNGADFDKHWLEKRLLLTGQIDGADLVALSHSETLDESGLHRISKILDPVVSGVIPLSLKNGRGIDTILDRIR